MIQEFCSSVDWDAAVPNRYLNLIRDPAVCERYLNLITIWDVAACEQYSIWI